MHTHTHNHTHTYTHTYVQAIAQTHEALHLIPDALREDPEIVQIMDEYAKQNSSTNHVEEEDSVSIKRGGGGE